MYPPGPPYPHPPGPPPPPHHHHPPGPPHPPHHHHPPGPPHPPHHHHSPPPMNPAFAPPPPHHPPPHHHHPPMHPPHHGPPPPPHHVAAASYITFGPDSTRMVCPQCNVMINTDTSKTHKTCTHVSCCCMFFSVLCTLCSCLPYCCCEPESVDHTCPNCAARLGVYYR